MLICRTDQFRIISQSAASQVEREKELLLRSKGVGGGDPLGGCSEMWLLTAPLWSSDGNTSCFPPLPRCSCRIPPWT